MNNGFNLLYDPYIRDILVEFLLFVLLGHRNSKIANSMKLVTFAFFSSQYHVFELKNIRGNLIAPKFKPMEPFKQKRNVPRGQQKDNISVWSRKKYFSSSMNAERLDII